MSRELRTVSNPHQADFVQQFIKASTKEDIKDGFPSERAGDMESVL